MGDRVWVRWYSGRKESWKLGVVNKVIGKRMFKIFIEEQKVFSIRHVDQLLHCKSGKYSNISRSVDSDESKTSASLSICSPTSSRVPLRSPVSPLPESISESNSVSKVVGAVTEEPVEMGDGTAPTDTAVATSVEADRNQSAGAETVSRERARQTVSEVSEGQAPQASAVIQESATSPAPRARSQRPRKKVDYSKYFK